MADAADSGESWRTDLFDIPGYLDAIGVRPAEPSLELLEAVHSAHVHAFPFANIDVLFGAHPGVSPDAVHEQLIRRRRGGYCFEHAQMFAAALEYLGFSVRRSLGRVHDMSNTRTHMTVIVRLGGRRWLCDPGFGYSISRPIAMEAGASHMEGGREFSVDRVDDGGSVLWVLKRDGEVQHYQDELTVHPADARSGHFFTSRHEDSPFTQHLMVMRHMPDAHITVTEAAQTVRVPGQDSVHTRLSVDEVVAAIQELGVSLAAGEDERLAAVVRGLRRAQER